MINYYCCVRNLLDLFSCYCETPSLLCCRHLSFVVAIFPLLPPSLLCCCHLSSVAAISPLLLPSLLCCCHISFVAAICPLLPSLLCCRQIGPKSRDFQLIFRLLQNLIPWHAAETSLVMPLLLAPYCKTQANKLRVKRKLITRTLLQNTGKQT